MLAFLLSSLEHRCAGSSDCGGVLEYIEPMCIEAHLEAHVLDLYIPTHLGLDEQRNYSRPTLTNWFLVDTCNANFSLRRFLFLIKFVVSQLYDSIGI